MSTPVAPWALEWAHLVERLDALGSELLSLANDSEWRLQHATGLAFFKNSGGMEIGIGDRLDPPEPLADWQKALLNFQPAFGAQNSRSRIFAITQPPRSLWMRGLYACSARTVRARPTLLKR